MLASRTESTLNAYLEKVGMAGTVESAVRVLKQFIFSVEIARNDLVKLVSVIPMGHFKIEHPAIGTLNLFFIYWMITVLAVLKWQKQCKGIDSFPLNGHKSPYDAKHHAKNFFGKTRHLILLILGLIEKVKIGETLKYN